MLEAASLQLRQLRRHWRQPLRAIFVAAAPGRAAAGNCAALVDAGAHLPSALPYAPLPEVPIYPEFISSDEESALLADVEPHLARRRYERGHWDAVISGGYRELQLQLEALSPVARAVAARVSASLPLGTAPLMPALHALDLAAAGSIGAHVDSIKFSGGVVAGISLLSDAVMQLTPADGSSGGGAATAYRGAPGSGEAGDGAPRVSLLLPRRSLYVLAGAARYEWQHAIPAGDICFYPGHGACTTCGRGGVVGGGDTRRCRWPVYDMTRNVRRERRISLIFRDVLL